MKVVFYPLSLKSMRSMKAMQALQPQLTALRNKYKSDPQRFQREQMELFRKHGVNPMGGCLPMIVQIPIFYALYLTLQYSVELQGAPFLFWITDLSKKDPYYVLPILMGISMLVQQKMTPTVGDPRQAQIMLIMPVVFTFMFLEFPTGLVLYWLVNNCLSILQQYLIDRSAETAESRRARRRAGPERRPRAAPAARPSPGDTRAKPADGRWQALGLALPPAFPGQIETYLDELARWERIGALTAYRDRAARVRHLVIESLMLLAVLPEPVSPLLDIGTGAGVPGLVLKLARPDWDVVLIDAGRRRANFLRHVVRQLALTGVSVEWGRAEALATVAAGGALPHRHHAGRGSRRGRRGAGRAVPGPGWACSWCHSGRRGAARAWTCSVRSC